jgi:hypothetical protein
MFFSLQQLAPAKHYHSASEVKAYVNYFNNHFQNEDDLSYLIPISTEDEHALFDACKDGVLLCKLVNHSVPGTINEKFINVKAKKLVQQLENHTTMLDGARKIGVQLSNIGGHDILNGVPHLVLGVIWQIIKVCY